MTLKSRLYAYLVVVHLMIGAVLIWQNEALGGWLFVLELLLLGSLGLGLKWARIAVKPHEIAQTLPDVIESGEYGARYPRVNQKEIDRVIDAYNRMLADLQHERLRLGEQRGFLEQFLTVTSVGILILDFDERISLVNPRAIELLGEREERDLNGCALAEIDSALAQTLASLAVDEPQLVTDSAGRRLRCQRSRFVDRGFARSYILIEELTAELNRSERETYEKLIRMMSHEVTNTVAATNSLLESCRNYSVEISNDGNRADYENALDVLITRNRNLNEFTRGFSDLVKLPAPNRQEVDVQDLLNAMRTIFKAELTQRGIELNVRVAESLPLVSMDRNQMDQVMINVIKNAAEAIDGDGIIDISAQHQAGIVTVSISDTGCGLDEDARRNLFSPFYTTKKQGQGLGLTLVKEILTQHGFAYSLEPAAGRTQFRIEMRTSVIRQGPRKSVRPLA